MKNGFVILLAAALIFSPITHAQDLAAPEDIAEDNILGSYLALMSGFTYVFSAKSLADQWDHPRRSCYVPRNTAHNKCYLDFYNFEQELWAALKEGKQLRSGLCANEVAIMRADFRKQPNKRAVYAAWANCMSQINQRILAFKQSCAPTLTACSEPACSGIVGGHCTALKSLFKNIEDIRQSIVQTAQDLTI